MTITITYLVTNMIRTYAIYCFINNLLQKKRFSNHAITIAYGIYYFITILFNINLRNPSSNLTINPFLNIVFNLFMGFIMALLYKTTFYKRLLATSFIYILSIASEDCTAAAIGFLFQTSISTAISKINLLVPGIIVSTLLMLGFVKLINSSLFKRPDTYDSKLPLSYWLAIFLVPAGSTYILHVLVTQISLDKIKELFLIEIIILILLVINFLIFYLYNNLIREESIKYENILLTQQNDAFQKQAKLIHKFQEDIRGQKHDMKHHLSVIKRLAEQMQIEALLEYINGIIEFTHITESGITCGDIVIDAIVNSKLYLASQQDTKLKLHIVLPDTLHINKMDITIILGNLLDNALEACIKLPAEERFILVDISYHHKVLAIEIRNPYDIQSINICNGKIYSTKRDQDWHGIGLNNVKQTVEKYKGVFEYFTSEENGKNFFIVQVLLY